MTKLKILVGVRVDPKHSERLLKLPGVDAEVIPPLDSKREAPAEILCDQEVLFCSVPPLNLDDMKSLKWIQVDSAGYDHLLPLELPRRGVRVTNNLGNFDVPIAEWNIAMMINLSRDLRGMMRNQERGVWDRDRRFQREIRGSVVGIWGYGGIGRETARLAKALGLKVHVLVHSVVKERGNHYRVAGTGDPEGKLPDRVFGPEQKDEFLRGLDFLILTMPLTRATKGIVGERELKLLPRHACLLNPARGPLIQEESLLRALREGWIAAAALDTHYHYPMPADHPLWTMPNVIMTPHISGSSESTHFLDRVWDLFIQNVERYLAGRELLNELTVSQLNGV